MDIVLQKEVSLEFLLQKTLDEIPKLQRDVFILKTIKGQKTKSICENLGINEKQFWNYIHNVRKELVKVL